jgi:hypothetical protein
MGIPAGKTIYYKHEYNAYCKYWWNVYLFDVYCAKRDKDRKQYDKAMNILKLFEAHILEVYPALLERLPKPVEWS